MIDISELTRFASASAYARTRTTGTGFAQELAKTRSWYTARKSGTVPVSKPSSMTKLAESFGFDIRNAGHGIVSTFREESIASMVEKLDGSVELGELSPEMKAELRKRLTEGNDIWDLDGQEGLSLADWDFFLADLVDMGMITNTERFCCNGTLRSEGSFAVGQGFAGLWKGDSMQYMRDLCALRQEYGEYESIDQKAYEHVARIIGAITDTPVEKFPAAQKTTAYIAATPNGNAFYGMMTVVHQFDFTPRNAGNGTCPTFSNELLDTMRDALDGSVQLEELSLAMWEELRKRLAGMGSTLSFEGWDNFLADLTDLGMISNDDRLCCNGTLREHGAYKYGWGHDFMWKGDPVQWLKDLKVLRLTGDQFPDDRESFNKVGKIVKSLLR